MALHAAAMMVFFVDQAQQAPVVVNCPALAPESPWKWIIQSVAPVAGGTLIAVWSFVANRKSEQRQWVRDQKKFEWKEIIESLTICSPYLPRVYHRQSFDKEEIDRIGYDPELEVRKLKRLFWSCLFIYDDIKRTGIDSAWEKVQENASKAEPFFNFGILRGYESGEYQEALDYLMELVRANVESSLALGSCFERKSSGRVPHA